MSTENVLKVENITMQFGGVIAVDNMNLEINKGEIVSLIGPNGAGKTTLLRLIVGEIDLDRDDRRQGPGIVRARQATIGMLRQQAFSKYGACRRFG